MKIPLFGETGIEDAEEVSNALTQNLIPHEPAQSKSSLVLYSTPGTSQYALLQELGEVRGLILYGEDVYAAANDRIYKVTSAGVATEVTNASNKLASSTGQVQMAHNGSNNGKQICIVDGTGTYIVDFETGSPVFNSITDSASAWYDADCPTGSTHVVFFDSYFVVNDPSNSGRFYLSDSYNGRSWNPNRFATAERSPDELRSIVASDKILFFIGDTSCELYYNAGRPFVPFKPVQSGFMQWGTSAIYSATEISGVVFWLTKNDEGDGMVVKSTGGSPEIISNPAIASEIQDIDDVSDAVGWSYQYKQNTYYVLTFYSGQKTMVYNLRTKRWHVWKTEGTGYHRASCHVFAFGKHLVGDKNSGKVWNLDWDSYTDFDQSIVRIRRSRQITADDGHTSLIHDWVRIAAKTGVGNSTVPDPKVHLRWRDNNKGWSNWYSRGMGYAGDVAKKLIWRKLGSSSDRVYEIRITDPVDIVLVDGYAGIRQGRASSG